jgi:hypothetical protein
MRARESGERWELRDLFGGFCFIFDRFKRRKREGEEEEEKGCGGGGEGAEWTAHLTASYSAWPGPVGLRRPFCQIFSSIYGLLYDYEATNKPPSGAPAKVT